MKAPFPSIRMQQKGENCTQYFKHCCSSFMTGWVKLGKDIYNQYISSPVGPALVSPLISLKKKQTQNPIHHIADVWIFFFTTDCIAVMQYLLTSCQNRNFSHSMQTVEALNSLFCHFTPFHPNACPLFACL